eukprot:jgi/Bigna1/90870/estExt_fgenesh1_pg.C_810086
MTSFDYLVKPINFGFIVCDNDFILSQKQNDDFGNLLNLMRLSAHVERSQDYKLLGHCEDHDRSTLDEEDMMIRYVAIEDQKPGSFNTFNVSFDSEKYPFRFSDDHTGELVSLPDPNAKGGRPRCHLCLREFPTYTARDIHKGKPCYLDNKSYGTDENSEPLIRIHFEKDTLPYIKDAINSLGLSVHLDDQRYHHHASVAVRKNMLMITLKRFYIAQCTKYNIEQWYPAIKALPSPKSSSLTASTVWFKLNDEELKVIQALCSMKLAENMGMGRMRMKAKELRVSYQLECKIDDMIRRNGGGAYFLRLSTRSPKDAIAVKEEEQGESDAERLKAKINSLKISTGEQALGLLARSQRVFTDISLHFQYRVKGTSSGSLCLILREFLDDLPQDHEFRCFIHKKCITAISQYDPKYVFSALQNRIYVEKLRNIIIKFHEKVAKALPFDSYVMDVAVLPDMTCTLIEMNPFGAHLSSGSALFHWENDFEILYGRDGNVHCNKGLPEMRILTMRTKTNRIESDPKDIKSDADTKNCVICKVIPKTNTPKHVYVERLEGLCDRLEKAILKIQATNKGSEHRLQSTFTAANVSKLEQLCNRLEMVWPHLKR